MRTLLLLVVFPVICAAQNSGKITYSISDIDFDNKSKNADIETSVASAKSQTFTLEFSDNLSHFFYNGGMDSADDFPTKLARASFTSASDYYQDKTKKLQIETTSDGTLVQKNLEPLKWQLTSDTKKIDKYQCYKATYTYTFTTRAQKTGTRTVVAWFAPELPFPYDPKAYSGLPGLILELKDGAATYLATKIAISEKALPIDWPRGKTINEQDYLEKINKQ